MTATMKRRLAKLEKRLQPAAKPALLWCFRDECGTLRSYDDSEPVSPEAERSGRIREMPLDEFRAICADLEERF